MGKVSKFAVAALLAFLPAKTEADSWFYFSATNIPGYHSYIPRGFCGPMVYWHARKPFYGFYSSGFFVAPHVRINLVGYERIVRVPVYQQYEIREPQRDFDSERFRGATENDGERELFRLLDRSGVEFGWRKYVKGGNGRHYQVDAIVGRRILDVVPTESGVSERSREIKGYEYHGIPTNRFNTKGEIIGGVRQEAAPFMRRRQ